LYLAEKKSTLSNEHVKLLLSIDFDHHPRKHYKPPAAAVSSNKGTTTRRTIMQRLAQELEERKTNTRFNHYFIHSE
jgi:hypothetical protein